MTHPNGTPTPAAPVRLTRRTAVKLALVGLAGAAVGVGATPLLRSLGAPARPYRFFSGEEAGLLAGICDQLIPRDAAPGAVDTGAITFIDRQLGGRYRRHRPTYRRGLESFQQTCARLHRAAFSTLTSAQKVELLQAVESGRVPAELWPQPSAPAFFNLVLAHTMQSFYGSPRHGGNRGYASYRMLGLDTPVVAGQNRHPKA